MDESPQATQESQVSALEESDNATDTTMPRAHQQRLNGIGPINGDYDVYGAVVYSPDMIINAPVIATDGSEASNNSAADVSQIPRVVEPDMRHAAMIRALVGNNSQQRPVAPPHPELAGPFPVVLNRQQWLDRQTSRAALLHNWPHVSSPNGVDAQQDFTTFSSWHNAEPSEEPYHNIQEIDHLGPPQETSHPVANGSPGSDMGAVAGSSPRNPEQAD